jgi:hypothetical protein
MERRDRLPVCVTVDGRAGSRRHFAAAETPDNPPPAASL